MYSPTLISQSADRVWEALRRSPDLLAKFPSGSFPEYSASDCRALTGQIVSTRHPETGKTLRRLSPEEDAFVTMAQLRVVYDAPWYLETFVWIDEEGHGIRPLYPLWESQRFLLQRLGAIELQHHRDNYPDGILINVLKARQLGISTIAEAIVSHRILTQPYIRAIAGSDVEEQAKYLFRMVERIYEQLPWFLKPDKTQPYNAGREMNFSNKSSLKTSWGKTTRGALQETGGRKGNIERGRTNSCVHISELATWDNPEQLDSSLLPGVPISAKSLVIFESTAELAGDWWHRHWLTSEEGEGRFSNIFIPWCVEPSKYSLPAPSTWSPNDETRKVAATIERDSEKWVGETLHLTRAQLYWYETTRAYYTKKNQLHQLFKEFPSNDVECFAYAGRSVFTHEEMERIDQAARKLLDVWAVEPSREIAELRLMPESSGDERADAKALALKTDPRPAAPYVTRVSTQEASAMPVPPGFGFRRLGKQELAELPNLRQSVMAIYEWPRVRGPRRYIIGVDVGDGLGLDDSVVSVVRQPTIEEPAEEVAQYVSNTVKPSHLAYIVDAIGRFFSDEEGLEALVAIEINNHGASVQDLLQLHLGYSNFYVWEVVDAADPSSRYTKRIGWSTTTRTRPILLEKFHDAVTSIDPITNHADFRLNSSVTRAQLRHFVTEGLLGEAEHAKGQRDDCLVPETLIRTRAGVKPIIDVHVGEEVLTHAGRWRPVSRVGSRLAEEICVLTISGRPALRLTDNHPLLVQERIHRSGTLRTSPLSGHDLPEWVAVQDADITHFSAVAVAPSEVIDRESISLIEYAPATYNVVGHRLVAFTNGGTRENPNQNKIGAQVPVDADFCRMLGYYYAEGSCGRHSVGWASHARETAIHSWLINYLLRLGLQPAFRRVSSNGTQVSIGSVPLNRFFGTFGSRELKSFPDWVSNLPEAKLREVVIGHMLGDGCFRNTYAGISAATISATGAYQLYEMSIRCGWPVTLTVRVPPSSTSQKPVWNLTWSSYTAADIRRYIPADLLACKRPIIRELDVDRRRLHIEDGRLLGHILKVDRKAYDGLVYNLEVEEDHSYVANGTVVHNCIFASAIGYYIAHRLAGGEAEPISERRRRREQLKAVSAQTGRLRDWRNSAVTADEADTGSDPDLGEFEDDSSLYFDSRSRA